MIVFRYLFGEVIYDRMVEAKVMPGRTTEGGGPRYSGKLERAGYVAVTGVNQASWRVLMREDEPCADFPADLGDSHERLWELEHLISRDFDRVVQGKPVPAEVALKLVEVFAKQTPDRLLHGRRLDTIHEPECSGSLREVFEDLYGEGASDLSDELYRAVQGVERVLSRIRKQDAQVPEVPLDPDAVKSVFDRLKKKVTTTPAPRYTKK